MIRFLRPRNMSSMLAEMALDALPTLDDHCSDLVVGRPLPTHNNLQLQQSRQVTDDDRPPTPEPHGPMQMMGLGISGCYRPCFLPVTTSATLSLSSSCAAGRLFSFFLLGRRGARRTSFTAAESSANGGARRALCGPLFVSFFFFFQSLWRFSFT